MPSNMVHASDGGRRALPLSWGGWAWEFLRRNPEYQSEWKVLQAQGRLPVHFHTGELEVRRLSGGQEEAARWDSWRFVDPSLDAWTTSVFWADGALSRLMARIQKGPESKRGFLLEHLRCQKGLLLSPQGGTLLLTGNGEMIALECEGDVEALLLPGAAFVLSIPGPRTLDGAISALNDFRTLLRPGPPEPLPRSKQLQSYLIALDAANAGASYRDIAILLYGEAAAARRWRDPARHMKDSVRYAVRRGGALMEGGYRRLLHKPPAGTE